MRKVVVTEFLSLDGVYQAPGDQNEDTEGGFRHGGWQMPYADDALGEAVTRGMAAADANLFGRKTYEIMASYWPTAPTDNPFANHLNNVQKYVASRTLKSAEWQNTTILNGNLADEIGALKEQAGKDIVVLGSGNLVQSLIASDLVDEYFLAIYPILLGSGKRLFADSDQVRKLRLVDSTPTQSGGLLLTYQPAR
jgi:dihydrofolate reductase